MSAQAQEWRVVVVEREDESHPVDALVARGRDLDRPFWSLPRPHALDAAGHGHERLEDLTVEGA